MAEQDSLIFVSHAAFDEELARALKRHIEASIGGLSVFVSSDPEDLPPGAQWTEKVLEALDKASVVLTLATDRGLGRRWVWFESGRTWHSNVRLIPCCLGKIRKNNLPTPFSLVQSLNIDEAGDLGALFRALEVYGSPCQPPNIQEIVLELTRLDVRCEERARVYLKIPIYWN